MRKPRLIACLVVIAIAMLWSRAFYGSLKAHNQGERHFKKQEYVSAVTFFDRSIRWYAPFNPYVRKSVERLWEIGTQAEKEGNTRLALIAMRTIRRGFYTARSFYTPGKDWIDKCDGKIDQLMELDPTSESPAAELRPSDGYPRRNQTVTAPGTVWSIILELGFLGWVGSMIGFIVFACKGNRRAKISTLPALLWGSLASICFAVWLIGLWRA